MMNISTSQKHNYPFCFTFIVKQRYLSIAIYIHLIDVNKRLCSINCNYFIPSFIFFKKEAIFCFMLKTFFEMSLCSYITNISFKNFLHFLKSKRSMKNKKKVICSRFRIDMKFHTVRNKRKI